MIKNDHMNEYPNRWWTLAIIAISVLNVVFDTTIVTIALPTFQRELGTTQSQLQWIVNSYMILFGSLMLITGALGDRYGHARILQIGLIAYAGASVAAAFSTTGGQLIFWRSVMGPAAAMVLPTTLAIITKIFPRKEQGKAIGIWAGVNALGIAVGPILAGLIIENSNWGWVFLINVPLAVVAVIAGIFLVPNIRSENAKKIDFLGALISTAGLAALIYGLVEGGNVGWSEPIVPGTLFGAIVLLTIFFIREKHTPNPLVQLELFRRKRFAIGIAVLCLMALAMMGINFTLTLYMQFVQGYTPMQTGVRFVPLAVGLFIGAGMADKIVARVGTAKVVMVSFLGLALMSLLAGFCQVDTPYGLLAAILFGWGVFLGHIASSATDAVMGALPQDKVGVGSGMTMVGRMVVGSMGTVLVSILSTVYTARFSQSIDQLSNLPTEAASMAGESVGAAVHIASRLPAELGEPLVRIAHESFMAGWQVMSFIIFGISIASVFFVSKHMPAEDEVAAGYADHLVRE